MTDATSIDSLADQVQIADMMTAQIEVLLADLRRNRDALTAQIAGPKGQDSSGNARIDKIRADLSSQISSSMTAIDALIAEAESSARQLRSDPSFA